MKTTFAMLTASMASAILAHPFDARSQQCNTAPSAATNVKIQPISQPSAATAEACLKACSSNASCKSFLFGLPADAKAPTCKLYGVAAAQVPNQGSELYIFDKACSAKTVPSTKPTHDEPRGQVKGKLAARDQICNTAPTGATNSNIKPFATPSVKTADKCQDACDALTGCQSFVFGLPADASAPICKLYKVAPAKIPSGDDKLYVFAKSCPAAKVPTSAPTHDEPRGELPSEQKSNDKSIDKSNDKSNDKSDDKSKAKTGTKTEKNNSQKSQGNPTEKPKATAKANNNANNANGEQKHN